MHTHLRGDGGREAKQVCGEGVEWRMDYGDLLPGKGQKKREERRMERDLERGEDQHRGIKDKEQAENKMTQHGCLTRWFRLPQ